MKKSLLQIDVCPLCHSTLTCESFKETEDGSVESGVIHCACGANFPLIAGIPRLLPPELQGMLWEMHPDFFSSYREQLPQALLPDEEKRSEKSNEDRATKAQRDTARSFGYEWQAFSEMLPDYESNFRWYFERFTPDFFAGKR